MLQLLTPLKYWRIKPRKGMLDIALPLLCSVILTVLLCLWPAKMAIFGENGFLENLQSLLAILAGFFVAALTVVATYANPNIDEPIAGPHRPYLKHKNSGEAYKEELTRRRFLCHLFGYLAFSAFSLYILALVANMLAPGISDATPASVVPWVKAMFVSAFTFWFAHMLVTSLLGLHYLSDRLQRSNPTLIVGNPEKKKRAIGQ